MVTIAVVGIGYWGKHLVRVFSEVAEVSVCVHQGSAANRAWLAEEYESIAVTTEYEEVLSDPNVNAVAIATPIETHYGLALRALEAGKDVYVEKPLAATTSEAKHLSEVASREEAILFVGYILVHHPNMAPLRARAADATPAWARFGWEKLGGFKEDLLLDIASHALAIACNLFSSVPTSATTYTRVGVMTDADVLEAQLSFDGGWFGVEVNRISPQTQKYLQVGFDNGDIYYWTEQTLYRFDHDASGYETVQRRQTEPLYVECERFVTAVEERVQPTTDGTFGYRVNETMDKLVQ
jgi:UDP-2-acetamido-3-amino-2,3-dideoxy-glucuronate N-acetyltransferase